MPTTLRRLHPLLPFVLLFVLALGLRLYRLDAQSLWLDEGGSWAEVTGRTGKGWGVLMAELLSPDAGYPLYHLLLKGWIALAGDSEWALRFPSALTGALAVLVLTRMSSYCSAQRHKEHKNSENLCHHQNPTFNILSIGFLATSSPFLLWHAQDAKAYSLLLLMVSLLFLTTLHALRVGGQAWLWVLLVALMSVFVHRLALLAVASAALGAWLESSGRPQTGVQGRMGRGRSRLEEEGSLRELEAKRPRDEEQGIYTTKLPFPGFRLMLLGIAALGAFAGLAGTLRAAGGERAFISRSGVGPLQSLWLTLLRFSVDRWPGDINGFLGLPLLVWLLPFALLGLWGVLLLLRDAWVGRPGAAFVLCILAMPLGLVMLLTALSPIYEARYTIIAFPGWLMVLAYPGIRALWSKTRRMVSRKKNQGTGEQHSSGAYPIHHVLMALAVLVSLVTLFQPKKGLFSGDALKEQWRDGIQYLAQHAQPDDLLLIHPSYVAVMYDYYAARVTPDPLPAAITFPIFAEGHVCGLENPTQKQAHECWVRRYDPAFNQAAFGKKRALLLIAPDHARTVDPPKSLEELIAETPPGQALPTQADRYGGLGLRFEYPQNTWPCGDTGNALIGVEVMCQSYPESFHAGGPGSVPEPDTQLQAGFGHELHLRGFSIRPFGDRLRPGGTLPITLYWSALKKPAHNYRMFLHVCRDCSIPPLANNDGPPLAGLFPAGETSSWQPGDPVHDERSLVLPADLAPGRYSLILGVYAGDGSEASRLAISNTTGEVLSARRLVLGEIVIGSTP